MFSTSLPYGDYRCSRNAPLSCDQPQKTVQDYKGARFCLECGFPTTLAAGQEIKGRRGTYQIKTYWGARGWGRLYTGLRLNDGQPILVKEYLLPSRVFSPEAIQQRRDTFARVAGLTPADGRIQDFRLLPIEEAIASAQDDRCYLVSQIKEPPLTLKQYLSQQGAMSAAQVRELLNQALQTLQFLHSQKFRRPSGQMEKGIAHGNLNLDSVLWSGSPHQFYIYLSDLADWEFLFRPPTAPLNSAQPAQDLAALGQIGFCLWMGTDESADFRDEQQWSNQDPLLKQFLQQLLGIETPFASAEAARQVLLQFPRQETALSGSPRSLEQPNSPKLWLWWLFGGVLLLAIAGFAYLFRPKPSSSDQFVTYNQLPKTFADVGGIESNSYPYSSERAGTWSNILRSPYLNPALERILSQPKPDVEAKFIYQPLNSEGLLQDKAAPSAPLQAVQQGRVEFAISSLTDRVTTESTLPIAYDGLLVFVPFTKEANSLPVALKGQIRLEDLRRLFTGEIKNWQELGGANLPVVLRMPTEPEAVRQFQTLVLQDDPQAIAKFWEAVDDPQPTEETLQQNRATSKSSGIISFGTFSKLWDQCGGYPLAIVEQTGASQALIRQSDGQPITPADNICDKANQLNATLIQNDRYPLEYPLVVVYPKDNIHVAGPRFADLLKTQQGQCLLSKVGLVPLQPVPDDCDLRP